MRMVRETLVRVKEIWDVPHNNGVELTDAENTPPVLLSKRVVIVGPVVLRPADASESPDPAPEVPRTEASERGYWSRLMKSWKDRP